MGQCSLQDETYIILSGNGQIWVQRPEDRRSFLSTWLERDSFPEKIGFRGCFSAQGRVGGSRLYDGTMDSRLLTDTFTRFMKPPRSSNLAYRAVFFSAGQRPAS